MDGVGAPFRLPGRPIVLQVDVIVDIDLPDGTNGTLTIPSTTTSVSTLMVGLGQKTLREISTRPKEIIPPSGELAI